MAKAPESSFNELHRLVTDELTRRVKNTEECTTADIKAAIEWLSKNNVTGVATPSSPLASLAESMTEADFEFVGRLVQ
jgi:hypothetical protein